MKFIKGFGKNYFSLSAITMFATAKNLQDKEVFIKSNKTGYKTFENEDKDFPDDLLLCQDIQTKDEDSCSIKNYIFNLINPKSTAPPNSNYIHKNKEYYIRREI